MLALEPREHPVRGRARDELPLSQQRKECADRVRCRPVVLGVVEGDVEILDAGLFERRVDVRAAEDAPESERGAVVGDRDHRLERLVERELRAGILERSVERDVLGLDGDRVVVMEVSGVDAALRLGENAQLVERRGDDLFVGIVGEQRRRDGRVRDPDPRAAGEGRDQAVELLDELRGARPRGGGCRDGDDKGDDKNDTDRAHP